MAINLLSSAFDNPFKPGAGHQPPYLAGRQEQLREFDRLLTQTTILENMVLTGLRGVGKTVLLDTFKPKAIDQGWRWVGADLSEATSLSEENLATRLLTDLSIATASIVIEEHEIEAMGFSSETRQVQIKLDYHILRKIFDSTPGLISDKIKKVLDVVWDVGKSHFKGIVFAYDEAQNLADHTKKEQYPLSLLLDVFQSIQKKDIPFMLVLTGLPTLFPKLVEARTFAERIFRVVFLEKLNQAACREAIVKPVEDANCTVKFNEESVALIQEYSGGYPYFIQFICREVFDIWLQQIKAGETPSVPIEEIIQKLDTDFFAGRWARATDRQRELLTVIASLDNCDSEFSVLQVVEKSEEMLEKSFSSSHVNQMLHALSKRSLIFKNRFGKYSFAVPLFGRFILRQIEASAPQ